ncbi:MAG: tRNA lysidine(34) synthetase TilS [Chlamydiota bacterium]
MKEPLVKIVRDFLSTRHQEGKPILLGYSGGVDSTAMLSLLQECSSFFSLDVRIVHFDHAWREESAREVLELKKKMEGLGLKFYSLRSSLSVWKESNKEEKAREERCLFFESVYKEVGAQALILAHQREDLAETVLKRFCEGGGILSLGGMQSESHYQSMTLWRPLLSVSREKLLDWNEKKDLLALTDSTNQDLRFLRPRMRLKMFPELEKWFGKGVQKNIASLGEEFSLLKKYMKKRLSPFLEQKIEGPLGFALLSNVFSTLDPFERQELIRVCLQEKGMRVGRDVVKQIDFLLSAGSFDKKVDVPLGELIVDGGNLFWLARSSKEIGSWGVSREHCKTPHKILLHAFFLGEISYRGLKDEDVSLCDYSSLTSKEKKEAASFFSRNKIPATMRRIFPFINKNGSVIDLSFLVNESLFIEQNEGNLNIKLENTSN